MNRIRKVLCVALVLLLLVASVPAVPVADLGFGITASALNATGKCGKTATYTFDSATGELVISGTGAIAAEAFYNNQEIKRVVIGDGITEIGVDAFNKSSLKSITVGKSIKIINDYSFYSCDSLESIILPDNVEIIGNYAFHGCDSLAYAILGNGVVTIGYHAFSSCERLQNVDMGNNTTVIGDCAFIYCHNLTNIEFGDNINTIGAGAFFECWNLIDLDLPDTVTAIGYEAFCCCYNISSITIGDSVVDLGFTTFANCSNLENVIIGNSTPIIKHQTFANCYNLSKVIIGKNVEKIEDYAFYDCRALESINIPKSVICIGREAFRYCSSLYDVYYEGSEEEWNAIEIGEYNTALENATIHFGAASEPSTGCEHNTGEHTVIARVEPTCTVEGHYRYYKCKCGVYFNRFNESNNQLTEVIEDPTTFGVIPALGHDFIEDKCSRCGDYDVCKHDKANTLYVARKDPTCTEDGFKSYYLCQCGAKVQYPSLDNPKVLNDEELIVSALGHDFVVATCTEPKMCKREGCTATEGTPIPHDVEGVEYTKYDDEYHSKKCNMCGADVALAKHAYTETVSKTLPTCVTEGSETIKCVCGVTKTVVIPMNDNHDWGVWTVFIAPSCTTDGAKERHCKREGCAEKDIQDIPALGHDMFVIESIVPTCQAEGNNRYYGCYRCDKYFKDAEGCIETTKAAETIAKGEHVFTKYVIIKDATCTANAFEKATCDICREATYERAIPSTMVAHLFKNYVSDGNATCIADGTMTAVCEMCKEAKDTMADIGSKNNAPHVPDKTGRICELCKAELVCTHTYSVEKLITKTPTCTTDGQKAIVCSKCKANKPGSEEVIPATGHAWNEGEIIKDATCKEKGSKKFKCNNMCGETKIEEIPVKPHNYKEVITHATCEKDGYSTFTCMVCRDNYIAKKVEKYGHMFETYFYDEGSATCYQDGTKTAECANGCGTKNTVADPGSKLDHQLAEFVVVVAPTCTTSGEREAKCKNYDKCNYVEYAKIPALGHAYIAMENGDFVCTRCGAVNGNETPDTGDHTYPDQWSVIIPATCKETGVAVKVCFDCHEVIAMVVPKAGHSDFDGDSKCDTCGGTITVVEPERPAEKPEEEPCNCDCHAGGIKAFFFKLINFFVKIFDKNARVCDCGKAH